MTTARQRRKQAERFIQQRQAIRDQKQRTADALARISQASQIEEDTDPLEAERQYAVLIREQYGRLPLSDPFYLRHLGLNDRRRGPENDLRHDEMPDVIRPGGTR